MPSVSTPNLREHPQTQDQILHEPLTVQDFPLWDLTRSLLNVKQLCCKCVERVRSSSVNGVSSTGYENGPLTSVPTAGRVPNLFHSSITSGPNHTSNSCAETILAQLNNTLQYRVMQPDTNNTGLNYLVAGTVSKSTKSSSVDEKGIFCFSKSDSVHCPFQRHSCCNEGTANTHALQLNDARRRRMISTMPFSNLVPLSFLIWSVVSGIQLLA